eukprot:53988-Eustigmatos_ZCMA.PRE.1
MESDVCLYVSALEKQRLSNVVEGHQAATMKTAVALSVCLSGASAFVPSTGFMGSAVTSKAAVSDSKIQMVFGLGAGAKKGGKASG